MHWAQLVRLPNVFTVLADVSAAFLLVSGGVQPIASFAVVLASGVALYWAGMILNDVFDFEVDRRERSSRPLAAGQISLSAAKTAGWGLLAVGIALAAGCSLLVESESDFRFLPVLIAVALAITIVLYDGPLKKTPLAPATMGACRFLSFLLGASPVLAAGEPVIPNYLLGIAFGFGVYVMGITTLGRREATGGSSPNLPTGLLVTCCGAALLAFAPALNREPAAWYLSADRAFPLLIGLIAVPVIIRGYRAVKDPTPQQIQIAVKSGILTIIPLAAAFAFLGAGPFAGIGVFALVVPSLVLATRLRVT